ncbi:hypothetical protein ACFVVM_03330 [Nocardia sp. NPDC058176]|uniref:Rv1733c family protein n=1 Tax=Nocardia sp. NPDC058176 TaxID=3346368 RepID=UPI0036DD1BB2
MTSSTFRIDGPAALLLRWWRCRPWSTNPLMRWPDRLRAFVRLLAVLVVLASVPIAGTVGTIAYHDDAVLIRAEHAQRTMVEAVVTERPEYQPSHVRQARVRWNTEAGTVVATVPVTRYTEQGDRISVWLDPSGTPVDRPRQPVAALMNGIGAAAITVVGAAFGGWLLVAAADLIAARHRGKEWDRELSAPER